MVRETATAAIGVQEDTIPTRPGEEHGDKLLRKKGAAVTWLRRGCRGATEPLLTVAVDRAVQGFPEPYGILMSPVFEGPARFVGK